MSAADIIDTMQCSCGQCRCVTFTLTYRPTCRFCAWGWHRGDPRRYHGAFITAGMSDRALTKAHINQLIQNGIPCGQRAPTFQSPPP